MSEKLLVAIVCDSCCEHAPAEVRRRTNPEERAFYQVTDGASPSTPLHNVISRDVSERLRMLIDKGVPLKDALDGHNDKSSKTVAKAKSMEFLEITRSVNDFQ